MMQAEIALLVGGVFVATAAALRVAFCRIARHTLRLIERHGWRDDWL